MDILDQSAVSGRNMSLAPATHSRWPVTALEGGSGVRFPAATLIATELADFR
jgi:hypothetical protein